MTERVSAANDSAARIAEALIARGERLAVAETTAGGLISARLLRLPGASAWFDRGVVCYSAAAKADATGITSEQLGSAGSVSLAAVALMADGLRARAGVQWAMAESGIAGPQTGRRSAKPAGYVAMAISGPTGTLSREATLPGSREEVMTAIAEHALAWLAETIESLP